MSRAEAGAPRADDARPRGQRVAVLVPCFNEALAIAKVVADFQAALPDATVYVYDNNSTDHTAEVARTAGAVVRRETHQGKGNVVRRMFADVDAEIYVLVDGDATYDAPSARVMIGRLVEDRLDMVVGRPRRSGPGRLPPRPSDRQPAAHRFRRLGVRRQLHGYSVGLPGVLPALREIVSGAVARLRDRDRADGACARAGAGGGRGADALLRAAARLGVEAQHLARRVAHRGSPSSISIARSGRSRSSAASASRWRSCRSGWRSRSS